MRGSKQIGTDREVQGLKTSSRVFEVSISGARGLSLRVFPEGDKVFEFRYSAPDGKRRRMQLGVYPGLSLAKARDLAVQARNQVIEGADPVGDRQAAKELVRLGSTVSDLAESYFPAAEAGLHGGRKRPKKARTVDQERSIFARYIKPELGDRRFAEIRRADVKRFMNRLAAAGDLAPASVAKIGEVLSAIFAFAVHEDRLEHNPVRGLAHPLALTSRERRFDDQALTEIWRVFSIHSLPRSDDADRDDQISRLAPQTSLASRFIILTLCRRGEACGARWPEIDRKAKTWTVPGERSKSGRPEVKPLSDAALAILDAAAALPDASPEYVFPTPGEPGMPLDEARPTRALARLCERFELAHGSPHDFRRSGATVLAGQYGISGATIGRILGHRVHEGAAVTSVYNRHDHLPEKRRALETWANHVLALQARTTNVVPFVVAAGA